MHNASLKRVPPILTLIALVVMTPSALAQNAAGVNPQRDCQTIVTCQFKKGGSFRGCVSSYSCRYCRFVPARCTVGRSRGQCQELKCNWGA
jgi:hypothetical protein